MSGKVKISVKTTKPIKKNSVSQAQKSILSQLKETNICHIIFLSGIFIKKNSIASLLTSLNDHTLHNHLDSAGII